MQVLGVRSSGHPGTVWSTQPGAALSAKAPLKDEGTEPGVHQEASDVALKFSKVDAFLWARGLKLSALSRELPDQIHEMSHSLVQVRP